MSEWEIRRPRGCDGSRGCRCPRGEVAVPFPGVTPDQPPRGPSRRSAPRQDCKVLVVMLNEHPATTRSVSSQCADLASSCSTTI
ncbi:hypothetical protein DV515_00011400 [Chloebia gouldiae]|uniref:Uncharacterized protein n=1 Tax=Chloebia gouldiae TaxID=44316 RepID=A0A3L8S6Y2_CHLGU|nr:hypothetical protein DV515_00011400 [Chloebia gouldiae]